MDPMSFMLLSSLTVDWFLDDGPLVKQSLDVMRYIGDLDFKPRRI